MEALAAATGARVFGATADHHRLPPLGQALVEGDSLRIGMDEGHVIAVPGHTLGHIAFYAVLTDLLHRRQPDGLRLRTAFLKERPPRCGTAFSKLAALPPDTLVYSGHEYTQSNLRFALSVDPQNTALLARVEKVAKLREAQIPSGTGDFG